MSNEEQKEIITINPATGKEIKRYAFSNWEETKKSIEKCHEAFTAWKFKTHKERAAVIGKIGEKLSERKDELAELMTLEMGKLVKHGKQEVDQCAAICKWTAENGPEHLQNEKRELPDGGRGIISYAPLGVIYGIQPWNFPAYQVIRYAIVNLMAGNGVLLKHAENVTGSAELIAEIFSEAGLPENLFTVLKITHDVSNQVIEYDLVRGVTLTGSSGAGKKIGEKAGANIKKTVLELGSNDAYMVLEDADIDLAVKICVRGKTYNNGETCVAAKRFIVVEKVYEEFKQGFVEKMSQLKVGDPTDKNSKLGPIAREDLLETLMEQVEKSVDKGAEVLCGGKRLDRDGYFYEATVLGNVQPGQPAYDDELFGPVASLIKAKDAEDAMRIANDSRFGLGGGIFSKNVDKAIEMAEKHFDTGMVFINGFGLAKPNMPFGGVKDSGFGREHGGFGMKEFVNTKSIIILNE